MAARLLLVCLVCCLLLLPATAQITCVDWVEVPPTSDPHPTPQHAETRISNLIEVGRHDVIGGYAGYQVGFYLASYDHDTGTLVDQAGVSTSFESMIHRPGCVVVANLSVGYSVFPIADDGQIGNQMPNPVGDYCKDVAPLGETMMLSANWGYLGVVDLADPWNPVLVCPLPVSQCGRVTVAGTVAYALTAGGFVSIDLSDPASPVVLAQVDLPGPPNDLDVDPPYLAVACGGGAGLTVYDVTDPSVPVLLGSAPTDGLSFRVQVVHDHAYVLERNSYAGDFDWLDALQLVALSTEAPPVGLGLYAPCMEATNVMFWRDRVVWPANQSVRLFPPQCPQVVGVPGELAAAPTASLRPARPNPFNPTTCLSFDLDEGRHVQLTLHDLTGRRLLTLCQGWRAAGRHDAVWNGRDQRGCKLASGTYVARLVAGDQVSSQLLSLVQ